MHVRSTTYGQLRRVMKGMGLGLACIRREWYLVMKGTGLGLACIRKQLTYKTRNILKGFLLLKGRRLLHTLRKCMYEYNIRAIVSGNERYRVRAVMHT